MIVRQVPLVLGALGVLACTYPFGDVQIDGAGGSGAGASSTSNTMSSSGGAPADTVGAGGANGEDCTNGLDDDGDTDVDCLDGDCAAFACTAPGGWLGPIYLAMGAGPSDMPSCPGGTQVAERGWVTVDGGAATCTACGCDGFTTCLTASFLTSSTCLASTTVLAANTCAPIIASMNYVDAEPSVISPGPCQANGGAATLPSNGDAVALCLIDCSAGGCVAETPIGVGGPCVYAPKTSTACPAGYPVVRQMERFTGPDTRDCSACTCGTPTGYDCDGVLATYSDANCAVLVTNVPTGSCTLAGVTPIRAMYLPSDPTGSCPPAGGVPIGVVATEAYNVCCAD